MLVFAFGVCLLFVWGFLRLKVNFPFSRSMEKSSNKKTLKKHCTTLIKYSVLKLGAQADSYSVS